MLAPIHLKEGQTALDGLEAEQLPSEAQLRPREGQPVQVDGRELVWTRWTARGAFLNFSVPLRQWTHYSAAYAVCYVESDRNRRDLQLQVGADDMGKVYLNGQLVYECRASRSFVHGSTPDTVSDITLNQGVNVVVFKVVNESGGWNGLLRFTDKEGNPVPGLHVRLTP